MKRLALLSALFVLVFVALLAGGVANARRAARERERILAAPVFPPSALRKSTLTPIFCTASSSALHI